MAMKIVGCLGAIAIFSAIALGLHLFGDQAHASLVLPVPPIPIFYDGIHREMIPEVMSLSAQQACRRLTGWRWRDGNFSMCFKPGHDVCPSGHPWMRRTTTKYTICLSLDNPSWLLPGLDRQ